MSNSYVGEIQMFGFNFNPYGWAFCNGATMPIAQNTALFSLLGTSYGGNGTTTFQLPNLVSRAACSKGQGPGLTDRSQGDAFGAESVTLTSLQIPSHTHGLQYFNQPDSSKRKSTPASGDAMILPSLAASKFFNSSAPNTALSPSMAAPTGGNQPHQNMQPYLGVNFCIALQGEYPAFP